MPSVWPLVAAALLLLIAVAAFDAVHLNRAIAAVEISAETLLAAYKDRLAIFKVTVSLPSELRKADIALEVPQAFLQPEPIAEAVASTTLAIPFKPIGRGEFHIRRGFVSAPSNWNLWRVRSAKPLDLTVKVFPDLRTDPAARRLFSSLQHGQRVQRLVGRGREVERLREYIPGDSFDEVYWKATARRGFPVTKVFQVERTQDIYAIVDGSRLGNRNQALERFVSASLLLALAAENNHDNFGLITFRDKVEEFVRASHGKGHFHRCREAIYDLHPTAASPDFAELFTFINLRIRKRALLFFLTDLSDPLLAETFLRDISIVKRRHLAIVDQVADAEDRQLFTGPLPETERDVQSRLAGHLQWAKLRELEKALGHIGVHMQLLRPDQTSAELINQYMSVKQRQLL